MHNSFLRKKSFQLLFVFSWDHVRFHSVEKIVFRWYSVAFSVSDEWYRPPRLCHVMMVGFYSGSESELAPISQKKLKFLPKFNLKSWEFTQLRFFSNCVSQIKLSHFLAEWNFLLSWVKNCHCHKWPLIIFSCFFKLFSIRTIVCLYFQQRKIGLN